MSALLGVKRTSLICALMSANGPGGDMSGARDPALSLISVREQKVIGRIDQSPSDAER